MSGPSERIGRTPSSTASSTISTARSTPKQKPNSSASKTSICPLWTSLTASILAIFAADHTDVYGLRWEAVPGDRFHQVTEPVELAEGGVDVWRDANALEFFVHDWGGENAMLVEEVTADGRRLDAFDVHVRNRTRLIRIERRVENEFG